MTKVDEQLIQFEDADTGSESDDEDVLVEEISIDGMCGVY
jgi:mycofactocin precursor